MIARVTIASYCVASFGKGYPAQRGLADRTAADALTTSLAGTLTESVG
jgi:hypothetical protein